MPIFYWHLPRYKGDFLSTEYNKNGGIIIWQNKHSSIYSIKIEVMAKKKRTNQVERILKSMTNTVDQGNMQEAALDDAIRSIRRMSAGRRFKTGEWKTFFGQDGMTEIISREKFLRELGDCFTMKAVRDDLYRILTEQLDRAESHLQSRKIDLTGGTGSDPLAYARSKIESANDLYGRRKRRKIYMAIFGVLLAIRLILIQLY